MINEWGTENGKLSSLYISLGMLLWQEYEADFTFLRKVSETADWIGACLDRSAERSPKRVNMFLLPSEYADGISNSQHHFLTQH
jgi:hypothetical protein